MALVFSKSLSEVFCGLLDRLPASGSNAVGPSAAVLSRVRKMNDLEKKVQTLSPAKRALLERRLAERNGGGSSHPLVARTRDEAPRASFAQERLWFLQQLE